MHQENCTLSLITQEEAGAREVVAAKLNNLMAATQTAKVEHDKVLDSEKKTYSEPRSWTEMLWDLVNNSRKGLKCHIDNGESKSKDLNSIYNCLNTASQAVKENKPEVAERSLRQAVTALETLRGKSHSLVDVCPGVTSEDLWGLVGEIALLPGLPQLVARKASSSN